MKPRKYLFIILFFSIATIACNSTKKAEVIGINETPQITNPIIESDQVTAEQYSKDGIEASYPKFISGSTEEQRNKWNKLIQTDFDKILQIYSFNPFPDILPGPTPVVPTILQIIYDIKSNDNHVISIFYTAAFNSPYSAHPTDLVYTTNIDKEKNKRLRLSDVVNINLDFVKDFRKWDYIPYEAGNEALDRAIRDYMSSMTDQDLLLGLQTADQIGFDNLWGIFSYLTPNRLGISVSVPNYLGDHIEFEREYSDIKQYLKSD
ncbi:MAG: hypothetical protein ACYDEX_20035 [Mobilitalea sp.]